MVERKPQGRKGRIKTFAERVDYIRKTLFPHWDKAGCWQIKINPSLRSLGYCDDETKTITLRPLKGQRLDVMLVHEICHSSCPHHGKKWKNKMLKKAAIAELVGDTTLAENIREEVSQYQSSSIDHGAFIANVYQSIKDSTLENLSVPYEVLIDHIAISFGVETQELEKYCKRTRSVWEKARKNATE